MEEAEGVQMWGIIQMTQVFCMQCTKFNKNIYVKKKTILHHITKYSQVICLFNFLITILDKMKFINPFIKSDIKLTNIPNYTVKN